MAFWRDLNDYKLQTEFDQQANVVLHRSYRANRALGRHKIAVEEKWAPQRKPLGAGSFGVVRLEKRLEKDGEPEFRAVKQLRKSDMDRMSVDYRKELLALTKFSRSKFVQSQAFVIFLGWFDDDEHVYIAMEYFQRGTLDMYIKSTLTEDDARSIAQQLFEGVRIMHEENFTHRDLKPQNIFVVQRSPHWWVKIGDFGISKRIMTNTTVLHTRVGTPLYLAPEVLGYVDNPEEDTEIYTNAVDIWSLACVVYEMLAARTPFTKWPRELITFCNGKDFPEAHLQARNTSFLGIEFLKMVMIPLPSERPSAEESLRSTWFHVEPSEVAQPAGTKIAMTHLSTFSISDATQSTAASNTWSSLPGVPSMAHFPPSLPPMGRPPDDSHDPTTSEASTSTLPRKPVGTSSQHSSWGLTSTASTIDSGTTQVSTPNTSTSTLQIPGAGGSLRPRTPEVHAALAKGKHVRSDSADTRLLKTFDWDNAATRAQSQRQPAQQQLEKAGSLEHRRNEIVHKPAVPTITPSFVTPEDGCARCSGSLTEDGYYLCDICNSQRAGIFAICSKCVGAGKHCDDEDHWLMKSGFDKGGNKQLSSETSTVNTGWSLMLIPGAKPSAVPLPHPAQFDSGRASSYPKKQRAGKAPYDYCFHCGTSFPSDQPPSRHMWEQHETIDGLKYDPPLGYAVTVASTTGWFSADELAAYEAHKQKMAAMETEMKNVFKIKVDEKVGKMKMSEDELYAKHKEMKDALERQRMELEEKKVRIEQGRPTSPDRTGRNPENATYRGGTSKSTRDRWLKWIKD